MLPKDSLNQHTAQGAFRQIFTDDENEGENIPVLSPQFKKIWALMMDPNNYYSLTYAVDEFAYL